MVNSTCHLSNEHHFIETKFIDLAYIFFFLDTRNLVQSAAETVVEAAQLQQNTRGMGITTALMGVMYIILIVCFFYF
jgi:hypothetical protein